MRTMDKDDTRTYGMKIRTTTDLGVEEASEGVDF